MGSLIEINDTLKLPTDSFPDQLELNKAYHFEIKGRRLYHLAPTRVFLVREIDCKWDYIGHGFIIELSIDAINDITKGMYVIAKIYNQKYREIVNQEESPRGKAFIPEVLT